VRRSIVVVVVVVVVVMIVVAMAVTVFRTHDDFMTFATMRMIGLGMHPAPGERNRVTGNPNSAS
jgi:hypothetical protein